jgi:tetratricopeptide (TPR) repeat protein
MLSAAKQGHPSALLNLGYFYDCGIGITANRNSAILWYKRALRKGYASAASNIGTIYRDEKKTQLALRWFEKAVALGEIEANLEIAKIYMSVLDDSRMAIRHLKLVALAKARIEVTKHSQEQAVRFLKKLRSR